MNVFFLSRFGSVCENEPRCHGREFTRGDADLFCERLSPAEHRMDRTRWRDGQRFASRSRRTQRDERDHGARKQKRRRSIHVYGVQRQSDELVATVSAFRFKAKPRTRSLDMFFLVYPLFVTTPTSVGRIPAQDVFFNCSAGGYPAPSITWTSSTGDAFVVVENFTSSGIATSRIQAVVTNSTNERATFLCTARNGLYRNVSAEADMSGVNCLAFLFPELIREYDVFYFQRCRLCAFGVQSEKWATR